MKNLIRTVQFVAQFVVLGLALAFVINLYSPRWVENLRDTYASFWTLAKRADGKPSFDNVIDGTPRITEDWSSAVQDEGARQAGVASYAQAVRRAAPAVVSVNAYRTVIQQPVLSIDGNTIPVGPRQRVNKPRQGSGVIFNAAGYVVTNTHVIDSATKIDVIFSDGQHATASPMGSDKETDLAVLRLDVGNTNLPAIAVPDQTPLEVGDVMLAIGSPFSLNNTVTMGIVSALGRHISDDAYENFIQTDAAINEGNSGGALVNTRGELVGINSSVYAPQGSGNIGIGFAIPIDTVKSVVDQIVTHGRVIRGSIGAQYEEVPITPDRSVVVVSKIDSGSPADAAGLQQGDVLTDFDGAPIASKAQLLSREAHTAPGTKVQITGVRSKEPFKADIVLGERPQVPTAQGKLD